MKLFKKLHLYIKFRKKRFKHLGQGVSYKQLHSKIRFSEQIELHCHSKILDYAYIDAAGGLSVGRCAVIAPQCTILTSNHYYDEQDLTQLPYDHRMVNKPVSIGDYCWIGRNVMIMPGVTIGEGSVIAAGSVVVKDIPAFCVAGGNPARVIRMRDEEKVKALMSAGKCFNDPNSNQRFDKQYL